MPDTVVDTTATTDTLPEGTSVEVTIDTLGDHDWYAITLTAGETYMFRTGATTPNGTTDTTLTLRDSAGTEITTNDDAGEATYSAVRFTATTSGTYYLDVGSFGSSTGGFVLTAFTVPPLTLYTNDQIANQLTNGFWGGSERHFNVAAGGTITYDVTQLTADGVTLANEAFALWSDVTGIIFSAVTSGAQIVLDDNQSGAFANSSLSGKFITSSTVNVGLNWLSTYGTGLNSYSFQTYVHEIGHAIGLGHAGNYNGSASYATDALYLNDAWSPTVMSYFDQTENSYFAALGFTRQFVLTPMIADAIATTTLYGTPTTTRTGDTVYGFNNTSGRAVYDAAVNSGVAYTVHDNGGIDTLDYSGYSQNQRIDLNAETFSNVGGGVGNVAIARGTVIENAIGGSGMDTLIGNAEANVFDGGAGNDNIDAGGGHDTVNFSAGTDYAHGGEGNDTLMLSGVASDYSIATLGLNHYEVTRIADSAVTEAVSFENVSFALDAVNDSFTVDAGAVRTLDVRENDTGSGLVIEANVTSGSGTAAVAASGTVVDPDLTTAYQSLDAGQTASVTILYLLSDGSSSDTATVSVTVNGVADAVGAVADANGDTNAVNEGLAAGAVVGVTALAADPDAGAAVTYSLDDDAGGAFQIDAVSGVISVANGALIDREAHSSLSVTVRSTSSDSSFSTQTFSIAVDDVDEFDVTSPADTSGAAGGAVTENAVAGSSVGIITLAGDADATNSGVTYSLADDDGGRFVIGPVGGEVLTSTTVIDREAGATRSITVRATSADGSFADSVFTIAVGDVDEFDVSAPVDTNGSINQVDATSVAGTLAGVTASAGDADATDNGVTYSLLAGGSDFSIDSSTGVVTVAATFNSGGASTRVITVQAASADGSVAQSNFTINVAGGVTTITGTINKDKLNGTAGADIISGLAATDTLFGNAGNDTIYGDDGNDIVDGGIGDDQMFGGIGNDTFKVDSAGDAVVELAGGGTRDIVFANVSIAALFAEVEELFLAGTTGSENLNGTGNGLANRITGNNGNNVLDGGAGNDRLFGGAGADTLYGRDGIDQLDGGIGDDILNGGIGRDVLTGGLGADRFVFDFVPLPGTTADRVLDFAIGVDKVVLSATAFSSLGGAVTAGNIAFGRVALDADDYLVFDAATGNLFYDADGNGAGASMRIASLDLVPTLTVADFEFVA